MLLNIIQEKLLIANEQKLLQKIRYKLCSQLRAFKEFHQLPIVIKSTKKHILSLEGIEKFNIKDIQQLKIGPHLQQNIRIQNIIKRQGIRLRQLLEDGKFIPFVTLSIGILSRYFGCLQKIQKKLLTIDKIVLQLLQKRKKA